MRPIPGFYYDEEKKRYFKITTGPSNLDSGYNQSTNLKREYQSDVRKKQAKEKKEKKREFNHFEELNKRKKEVDNYLNLRCNKISDIENYIIQRKFLDPKTIVSSFTDRFIKPKYVKLLKKKAYYSNRNSETSCYELFNGDILIGNKLGAIQILGTKDLPLNDSLNQKIDIPSQKLIQSNSSITSMKLIDNKLFYTNLGSGESGKFCVLSGLDEFAFSSDLNDKAIFSPSQSSIWCMESIHKSKFVLGCEKKLYIVDFKELNFNHPRAISIKIKSDVFSLCTFKENQELFFAGTRSGEIHLVDIRVKSKNLNSKKMSNHKGTVNQIHAMGNYGLLSSALNDKIYYWDYRMVKDNKNSLTSICSFEGYTNNCLYDLKFHVEETTSTIISGGTDNKIRFWDIISSLPSRKPLIGLHSPVKQIIPYYSNLNPTFSMPQGYWFNFGEDWELYNL